MREKFKLQTLRANITNNNKFLGDIYFINNFKAVQIIFHIFN